MEAPAETFHGIQSRVSSLTAYYAKEFGVSRSEAQANAAEDVGKTLNPPMTGKELNSWLARQRVLVRNTEPKPLALKAKGGVASVAATYRTWCETQEYVAPDAQLAHFNGHTAQAYATARDRLKKEGYEFERVEAGWHIVARPAPKAKEEPRQIPTEDEVRGVVGSALSAALGTMMEAVTRDVMAQLGLGGK